MSHSTDLTGFYEILNLTYPELIKEIHEKYLKAGADIIETNTHKANEFYLKQYDLQGLSYEINFTAAKLAREIATKYTMIRRTKPRFVFGAVGPIDEELDENLAEVYYSQQFKGLIAVKVDAIVLETFIKESTLRKALEVLNSILQRRNKKFYAVISVTVTDEKDKLFISQELLDEYRQIFPYVEILAVGENCGLGPEEVLINIRELAQRINYPIIAYPNAGLTYDEPYTATQFAAVAKQFLDEQLVNIIGSCCETTPEYTELLANLVKQAKPRKIN
jgi:5-methyltetrahydrofolate--homocysteine methyltransferase